MSEPRYFLLGFYVPETHLEAVLEAVFSAGAGEYGAYDRCAWTCPGEGRFRPGRHSSPFIGEAGADTRVPEIKAECIVPEAAREAVKAALIGAHPYEEPAFHFIPISR